MVNVKYFLEVIRLINEKHKDIEATIKTTTMLYCWPNIPIIRVDMPNVTMIKELCTAYTLAKSFSLTRLWMIV